MISKRYVGDYRLEYVEGTKGKLKLKAVYTGNYYVYSGDALDTYRIRRIISLSCMIAILLWIAALVAESGAHRSITVILPFAINIFPLMLTVKAGWIVLKKQPPFIREYADRIEKGLPASSFISGLLSGLSFIQMLYVFLFGTGMHNKKGDIWFTVCSGLIMIISFAIKNCSGKLKLEVVLQEEKYNSVET